MNKFNSNGFSFNGNNYFSVNVNSGTFVAWCWKAGGAAVTNNDGSNSVTLSANPEAGFSIIQWAGTDANATVGHGLGKKPKFFIVRSKTHGQNWFTYHEGTGATKNPRLNDAALPYTTSNIWNDTEPTNTVINLGSSSGVNGNGNTYICYCWTEIPGFSSFGTYIGTGNAEGPHVFTGFKPAWVMTKSISGNTSNWNIFDLKRPGRNPTNDRLFTNDASAEVDGSPSNNQMRILSTGFKLTGSNVDTNGAGSEYIYIAYAEEPTFTPFGTQSNPS